MALTPQLYVEDFPLTGRCQGVQQEPLDLVEAQNIFPEEACVEHRLVSFDGQRGIIVPMRSRLILHLQHWQADECSECKYEVSVTAGTIFDKRRGLLWWTGLDDLPDLPSEERYVDAQEPTDARDQSIRLYRLWGTRLARP